MTRPLVLLVAVVAAYEAFACKSGRVPTITHIVHVTRLHFRPACPQCGVRPLVPRQPRYRGWHTARPS
jgi:hypothetical protein